MQAIWNTAFLFDTAENVSYRKTDNSGACGDLVKLVIVLFRGSIVSRQIYPTICLEIR
jgi:hypothetical protein